MARHDALTGLPNRESLCERLGAAIDDARPHHHPLALLHIQVGRYQEISDALGYREVDQLIQALADRLSAAVRLGETLARVGEADFALLLPASSAYHATAFAQELVRKLGEPLEIADLRIAARATIGISLFPGHGAEPDALMRRAKVAANEAKRTAAGYSLYKGSLDADFTRRLALMGDLSHAIERSRKTQVLSRHLPTGCWTLHSGKVIPCVKRESIYLFQ